MGASRGSEKCQKSVHVLFEFKKGYFKEKFKPVDAPTAYDGLSGPVDDPLAQLVLEVGRHGAGDDVLNGSIRLTNI